MSDIVRYPGVGCIVEFMEGNAPQIAWIMESQSGRLRVLLPNRRETRLGINRLLPWAGPNGPENLSRDEAIAALEKAENTRKQMLAEINALEIWDMAQGEIDRAQATWFAELLNSNPDINNIAAMGHALLACKSHFKFQPPDFEILSATVVEARQTEQEITRRREAIVQGGSALFKLLYDVHCKKSQLPANFVTNKEDTGTEEHLKHILFKRIITPDTQEDQNIWQNLVKGLPDDQFLALHLATAWGLVPAHYNFWLNRADYCADDSWAKTHQTQIEEIISNAAKADLPVNNLPFTSIDSITTKDIDDAFYIEALENDIIRVHLALACPALGWPFGSELDKAVFNRSTSIYLPEATHHMLPEELGANTFSLLVHEVRPALCCICDVNSKGEIISCEPSLAKVKLADNLYYEDCEAVLEGKENNAAKKYETSLILAEKLALLRRDARIKAGAVVMDRPDPQIILNGQGEDTAVTIEEYSPSPRSQLIISEMMIMANAAFAAWGKENGLALLHRTQDVAIPPEYAGVWTEPHQIAKIIRVFIPASLEVAPRLHAGLGLAAYSTVTSPLRRYSDLLNEAQIINWLQHKSMLFKATDLENMLPILHSNIDAATQIQRFRPRYWKLLYLKQQGDKAWHEGIITEVNDAFITVILPREQIFVRAQKRFFWDNAYPSENVKVRLGKINPLYNEIYLLEAMENFKDMDNK